MESSNNNIYKCNYDNETNSLMNHNTIFCTFINPKDLQENLNQLFKSYKIKNNKIFVLDLIKPHQSQQDELILTYGADIFNMNQIPENTILVHRKQQSNSLYTINGLNEIIKNKNNGVLNKNYQINWNNYRNSLILTRDNQLYIMKTKLNSIREI